VCGDGLALRSGIGNSRSNALGSAMVGLGEAACPAGYDGAADTRLPAGRTRSAHCVPHLLTGVNRLRHSRVILMLPTVTHAITCGSDAGGCWTAQRARLSMAQNVPSLHESLALRS
jgi:hypothetical protein